MVVVVMGVAGAGKTTVGRRLALELGWAFVDADDMHPAANVERMRTGEALTEADRRPWLEALAAVIAEHSAAGTPMVLAVSALRREHRKLLLSQTAAPASVRLVHLRADPELLARRLQQRTGHFFPGALLASQLATLEPPDGDDDVPVVVADADLTPDAIVKLIRAELDLRPPDR